jgi:hypothetical protein
MHNCTQCHGLGLRAGRGNTSVVCNCSLRTIFRICFQRFQECASQDRHVGSVTLEYLPGKDRRVTYSRKDEEYVADFCNVSARALDIEENRIFRYHFLLGADWAMCCRKLNMDRGNFFHSVYRIQQKLGKVFRELQPYALYPLDEYFHGAIHSAVPSERVVPIRPGKVSLSDRVPLRRPA